MMKNWIIPILFLVAAGIDATPKKKISIREYYLLLPTEALIPGMETPEARKKILARDTASLELMFEVKKVIDDPKNGYLAIEVGTDWGNNSLALAIWRGNGGEDIIGVSYGEGSPKFYAMRSGTWHNISAEVFGDFKSALFKPRAKWPAHCGTEEGSSTPQDMEFPRDIYCPVPRKGLDITCTFAPVCRVHGSVSVFETDFKHKPTDYYAITKRRFVWQKGKFVPR